MPMTGHTGPVYREPDSPQRPMKPKQSTWEGGKKEKCFAPYLLTGKKNTAMHAANMHKMHGIDLTDQSV